MKNLRRKYLRGRTYRFIPIASGVGNFVSETRKSGMSHTGGVVDVPFPRSVRDALLTAGLAQEHRWVPNSGWITFQIRSETDFKHAVWLMRLSYLRYALKTASDPRRVLDEYSEELQLSPQFKALLEPFVPRSAVA